MINISIYSNEKVKIKCSKPFVFDSKVLRMFSSILIILALFSSAFAIEDSTLTTRKDVKLLSGIPINRVKSNCLKSRINKSRKPIKVDFDRHSVYSPDIYGLSLRNEENFDASKYLNKY